MWFPASNAEIFLDLADDISPADCVTGGDSPYGAGGKVGKSFPIVTRSQRPGSIGEWRKADCRNRDRTPPNLGGPRRDPPGSVGSTKACSSGHELIGLGYRFWLFCLFGESK